MNYMLSPTNQDITHHGVLGQKWGKRNGPPYPLGSGDHSASEKKAGWRKSLGSAAKKVGSGTAAAAKKAAPYVGKAAKAVGKATVKGAVKVGEAAAPQVTKAAKAAAPRVEKAIKESSQKAKSGARTASREMARAIDNYTLATMPAYRLIREYKKQKRTKNTMTTLSERQSMSDSELQARYNRVKKENDLRELEEKNRDIGIKFVGNVSEQVASRVITTAATGGLLYLGAAMVSGKGTFNPKDFGKAIFYGGAKKKG